MLIFKKFDFEPTPSPHPSFIQLGWEEWLIKTIDTYSLK